MKKRYTTIKDIAKALHISVSTVSRAMRDTYDVSPETRKKVLETAKLLDYKPNFNATALVQNSTRKLGILIPSITNYYFSTVITGIQEVARKNGFSIVLYITDDDAETEIRILEELSIYSMDGLLCCIASRSEATSHFRQVMDDGLPVVFFDRVPASFATSKVMQDDFNGACLAVRHLLAQGYRRIAHLAGPEGLELTRQRLQGFGHALSKAGIAPNPDWVVHSGFSQHHGRADMEYLLSLPERPDAVFAVNDPKAIGALLCLRQHGIEAGSEIGVIGFTNDPVAEIISPSLSTVAEPALEIGRRSCELLLKHIRKSTFPGEDLLLSGELIIRESTNRNR